MIMVRAIVRPEKATDVMAALLDAGFPAVTKMSVHGRGKQRGLKVGDVHYDELPKEMLMLVVPDDAKEYILRVIAATAKTGSDGQHGDGKVFISPVDEVYTVRTGEREGAELEAVPA
ncbi:MAG: P-II family nitrogen regulator [Capsulimonadaceae bacterium]